jgi:hypothetical protein
MPQSTQSEIASKFPKHYVEQGKISKNRMQQRSQDDGRQVSEQLKAYS